MLLAFAESLAFISLLVPAWGALVAIGALIGVSGINFWPIWIAGGIGSRRGQLAIPPQCEREFPPVEMPRRQRVVAATR